MLSNDNLWIDKGASRPNIKFYAKFIMYFETPIQTKNFQKKNTHLLDIIIVNIRKQCCNQKDEKVGTSLKKIQSPNKYLLPA